MSVSALVLLLYADLVEAHEEELALHRYAVRRGRNIVIAFSDNYGYSLILYLNSTSGGFLKAGYNVESETISILCFLVLLYTKIH